MKFLEKQQIVIFALAIVVIAGFGVFRYYPLVKENGDVKKAKADHLADAARTNTQIRQMPVIRDEIDKLRRQVGDFESQIPQHRSLAGLWQEIADIMNTHNLTDQLVQPGDEIHGERLSRIPLKIRCSGALSQIFEFFRSIEQLDRLIRVEHLDLAGDKDFSGYVTVNAQANVYYQTAQTGEI